MKGYLLRDLKRNTELLILAEFLRNLSVRRKEMAERLGVTEQAISQYVTYLEKERLITSNHGRSKPTRKGIQLLQERLFGLREEIENILRNVQVIDTCLAMATAPIKANDPVGLVMRDGKLVAIPNTTSSSMGIARADANRDEEVLVGNLEGVVELELGELHLLQLPFETAGGSKSINLERAINTIREFSYNEIAVGDLIGEVIARKLKLKPDIVYAPIQASLSALSKGLNVLFLGTVDSVREMVSAVESLESETGYKISHRTIDVPLKQRKN